jgi:hypothetical protein
MEVYVVLGTYRVQGRRTTIVLAVYARYQDAEDAIGEDSALALPWIESYSISRHAIQ